MLYSKWLLESRINGTIKQKEIQNLRKRGRNHGFRTFKGGIHPYEGKRIVRKQTDPGPSAKGRTGISSYVSAYRGTCKTIGAKGGDRVLAGQKIGETGGFISANVICSVSGTSLRQSEPRRMVNGAMFSTFHHRRKRMVSMKMLRE